MTVVYRYNVCNIDIIGVVLRRKWHKTNQPANYFWLWHWCLLKESYRIVNSCIKLLLFEINQVVYPPIFLHFNYFEFVSVNDYLIRQYIIVVFVYWIYFNIRIVVNCKVNPLFVLNESVCIIIMMYIVQLEL